MSDTNRNVVSFPSGGAVQRHEPYEQPVVRLPRRIPPMAMLCLALPLLYWLAATAFTPAGMARFTAGLGQHIGFLIGTSDGNRVASVALFALGLVGGLGLIRHAIIKNYGLGPFGYGELLIGAGMGGGAVMEWHLGQIGLLLMLGLVWGAYILILFGWRNIQNDPGVAYAPQFQGQELPEQDIYGAARAATDEEIDNALRDRPRVADRSGRAGRSGYRYRE